MAARYGLDSPLVGIDYGSKLAGTTVLTIAFKGELRVLQSVKKKDADKFILNSLKSLPVGVIGLDAPLSLPGVYTDPIKYDDYFYRACDRELKAMSPMFLGGLTARAMRLTHQLRAMGWEVGEVYPAALVKAFPFSAYAKTQRESIPKVLLDLSLQLNDLGTLPILINYHQVDSAIALLATYRKVKGEGRIVGDAEGTVWV